MTHEGLGDRVSCCEGLEIICITIETIKGVEVTFSLHCIGSLVIITVLSIRGKQ